MYDFKKVNLKLEEVAKKFPNFIRPSLNKAHIFHSVPKYPKMEQDLMEPNSNVYMLYSDHSENPEDSIRVWIGALWKMQLTSKLDNAPIFILAEKL